MAANSIATLYHHNSTLSTPYFLLKSFPSHRKTTAIISLSFAPHRRRRRRNSLRNPNKNNINNNGSSSNSQHSVSDKLQFILDVDQLKSNTPISIVEEKVREFIEDGIEAYQDLRSLIRVDNGSNRVVVSCSGKSVRFVGGVLVWSCVGVVVVRVLVGLGLGFRRRVIGMEEVVTRRDRSLGGKEVVVARRVVEGGGGVKRGEVGRNVEREWEATLSRNAMGGERKRKLPSWWPSDVSRPILVVGKEEYQREAKQLIRAIMDDKLRGKDVSEEDILELRRICRKSGVQLSFETENARDSLYRLSVHNVLNTCCRGTSLSAQIDGEDPRLFLAGLAYDIGLPNFRAATIVSAAVAAQTRQWFLQAWALDMQVKHSEAMEELKKICLIHQIFPPEPFSPEIEMVAKGLEKHLTLDQREFLLSKLVALCGEEHRRSAAEALGVL